MIKTLDGKLLKEMILGAAAILEKNKETLDSLNVFPVPDGDTGTNMSLTMISAAKEVAAVEQEDDLVKIVQAMSLGALKGARGNSGVILSQIFAGFADAIVKAQQDMTTTLMAQALRNGVEYAYKAVMKPKEGTILTVTSSVASAAEKIAEKTEDLYEQLEYIIREGEKTLKQTPEMLPVLKEAGVVDAGGAGFLVILMGYKSVLDGETVDSGDFLANSEPIVDFSNLTTDDEDIKYAYCTEFFIKNLYPDTKERDIDIYRNNLSKIGDCVLVVGDLNLVKTHVHTNEPGLALQYAQILGELSKIKIDNMREQHRELSDLTEVPELAERPQKEIAVVAVVAGDGIKTIFEDWQVEMFVEGGQSMNPSAQDLIRAIESAPSDNIIVLPNNKNIILAAEQASDLCKKNVVVLKTKTIPQGIAAAVAYDPEADIDANVKKMQRAIDMIKTGSITSAVRDTKINGTSIHLGELLGIAENTIVSNGPILSEVYLALLQKMIDEDSELLTIYYGEGVDEDTAAELVALTEKEFPQCDIELHYGGQPVYPYIISVE
ncbi:phosphatase [Christensenellaceae bacterium]|nr:phosphatase [Christensenellaceae bacterium]BDF60976.1 phosphatase [Christensenellaceae bacterium]